ncbi:hypothetical protein QOZ80_3BG0266060 [Eleusine coracana subsp. coracana]|nr:hypothetical protein QOZ80_3BG0266060 [Eleusine coracana subsp. coracana]
MAAAEVSPHAAARMKLTCSHGGRFVSYGPDGAAPRYVGGETRVLAVPRSTSFRDLAARLSSEMAGRAEVSTFRHRLADDEDIIVSVTCDDELAHMRDEYDRLRATRPAAAFRVFLDVAAASASRRPRRSAAGLPPLAPRTKMRRVQSEQALPLRAQPHRWPAACPAPVRRVQSAQEIAAGSSYRLQPSFHQHQYCRDVRYEPVTPAAT